MYRFWINILSIYIYMCILMYKKYPQYTQTDFQIYFYITSKYIFILLLNILQS